MKDARPRQVRKRTSGSRRPETEDRRVRRTKASLHDALIDLARQKPYDSVAVKEVLARADVGRSTFYEHFRDKDDLLNSGIDDVLRPIYERRGDVSAPGRITAFGLPFLEHLERHRHDGHHTMAAESRHVMHGRLRARLAARILEDLETHARPPSAAVPNDLLALHIASTFVLALTWWLDEHPELTPMQVDAQFRALVLPALRTAQGI